MAEAFTYTGYNCIENYLNSVSEEAFAGFQRKLIPGEEKILGVRTPKLRALAKKLAGGSWRRYIAEAEDRSMEETMLQGFVIAYAEMELPERLGFVASFVPKIKSWAVCDTFCPTLKSFGKNRKAVFTFLKPYFKSKEEFSVRFAVITLMDYFICDEYIDRVFNLLDSVRHSGYYVKMAVAWAVSMCFVKFPEKTYAYLGSNALDDFTYNKALQKITESYRVSGKDKAKIRSMKRPRASSGSKA